MSSRIRIAVIGSITVCAVLASGTALVRASTDDSTTTSAPPDSSIEAPSAQFVPAAVKPSRIKLPRRQVSIAYARVVLDEQQAYFYNAKRKLIAKLPVSTGLDNSTPTGRFKVFSRSAQSFYTPRPQEKMKFMTRFTLGRNGGNIGYHGIPYLDTKKGNVRFPTPLGLAPSSHGCIRMLDSHAQWVFDNLPQGATVAVVKSRR